MSAAEGDDSICTNVEPYPGFIKQHLTVMLWQGGTHGWNVVIV